MTITDDDRRRTRPGTPMEGPYSTNEMDDFYAALAGGEVKTSGLMNLAQKLYITARCRPGDRVVDACCGSGLQLPVLYRYCPDIQTYLGLDISADNLDRARRRRDRLTELHGHTLRADFESCDVSEPWPVTNAAEVVIYTSALEHLPRERGRRSLEHAADALTDGGRLYLSTPNTAGDPPRILQHRVHVYEWSHLEVMDVLAELGLVVENSIGILAPEPEVTENVVESRFGSGAVDLLRWLQTRVPSQLLDPVIAAALEQDATEILYVCRKDRQ